MKLSIALSAVIALLAVGAATAAPAPVGNFVTLHLGPSVGQFRGAVKSDVLDCIFDRKVRIVRVSGDDTRVGVGFTDDRGHFSIQTTESSGDWIAKVKRTPIGNGYVCAGAKSKIRSAG
jgi:hypothetical protein